MKKNKLARLFDATVTAVNMPKAPSPLEVADGNKRLYRDVLMVATRVNQDMAQSCEIMDKSAEAIKASMSGTSPIRPKNVLDHHSLQPTRQNIEATAAFLMNPEALIELGRFQAIFPGLPFDEQARLMEPLAKGETLIGAGDKLYKRVMTLYHADGLSIPPVLQHLSEVPTVRALFAYGSVFARHFINATESFQRHKDTLEDLKLMNAGLSKIANDLAERFGEQERARLASFAEITNLLASEELLLQAAQSLSKEEDRTSVMQERAKVISELAEQMSINTYSELATMDADARSLQVLGVQLDSEKIRQDLFRQVLMDYRNAVIAHRALNTTLNLIQHFLMGAALAVREIQAAYITHKLSEAKDLYSTAKQDMDSLLTSFEAQFLDVNTDGIPDDPLAELLSENPQAVKEAEVITLDMSKK